MLSDSLSHHHTVVQAVFHDGDHCLVTYSEVSQGRILIQLCTNQEDSIKQHSNGLNDSLYSMGDFCDPYPTTINLRNHL